MVGKLAVGGGAPVSIQTMTNTLTSDAAATIKQIEGFAAAGCDIVRLSVPDEASLQALPEIRRAISLPLIADIHFNHKLAIGAIEAGFDGVRINPGNIGGAENVREVARAAIAHGTAIRVGSNLGSVKRELLETHDNVSAIVASALDNVKLLEDLGVANIKVALKSSDVLETIQAYRRFAAVSDWPLHVGVTEAGTLFSGLVRSSVGIGALLLEGLGDTIRISLSDDPLKEVLAARTLLEALDLRHDLIHVVACPTCARSCGDVAGIAREVEAAVANIKANLTVAVMGCIVNGPGEARHADLGVACEKNGAMLFKHGEPARRITTTEIVSTILTEIEKETSL